MISRLWDTQVNLTNLRGVEVAELTEENVPLIKNPLQYAEGLYHFLLEIRNWNYSSSVTSTSGLTAFIIPVASKKSPDSIILLSLISKWW